MKNIILCICISCLVGCISSSTKILNYISNFVGQDVENVFSILGYPDDERNFRDRKMYIWSNNSMQYIPNFQYNPYGLALNGGYYAAGNCVIKIITDRYGKIIDAQIQGNEYGCELYAQNLQ